MGIGMKTRRDTKDHEGTRRRIDGKKEGCGALPHAPAGRSSPCTPGTSAGRALMGRIRQCGRTNGTNRTNRRRAVAVLRTCLKATAGKAGKGSGKPAVKKLPCLHFFVVTLEIFGIILYVFWRGQRWSIVFRLMECPDGIAFLRAKTGALPVWS